jgi:hypothetical protein
MTVRGIDGVLVVTVTGNTGSQQQYAGTVTTGNAVVVGNQGFGSGNERISALQRA